MDADGTGRGSPWRRLKQGFGHEIGALDRC